MKPLSIILSFVTIVAGCYTNTPLTKDSPSMAEVSFRLKDGTYILSQSYQRVENGYKIVGRLVNKEYKSSKPFDGTILDEQIKEAVAVQSNKGKTVVAVVMGIGIAVTLFALTFPDIGISSH